MRSAASRNIATILPAASAIRYIGQFVITGNTKIPPCGAGSAQPKSIESAPDTADPTMQEGNTRSGSEAANGITPSVTKHRPMI